MRGEKNNEPGTDSETNGQIKGEKTSARLRD